MDRVLLIAGNAKFAVQFDRMLTEDGYQVDWAYASSNALLFLRSQSYALVVLDVALPGGRAWSLLEPIKLTQRNASILALTKYELKNYGLDSEDSGIDDYLVQPCELSTLREKIHQLTTLTR